MESTVSVSKGVFVFKNGFKNNKRRSNNRSSKPTSKNMDHKSMGASLLWHDSFTTLWRCLEQKMQKLNDEMFSNVLSSLVKYVKDCYQDKVTEIPATALMTGINMPDHAIQFTALAKEIKQSVTSHVAYLPSQDCQNLKSLVENMVFQLIGEDCKKSDDEEDGDIEGKKFKIKKWQCNFTLLQAWYENCYQSSEKNTGYLSNKEVIVVIIPDFESFNEHVLQKFILIVSSYINILPFVLIFGVATSLTVLHRTLPYHVSSKINVTVFNSQPSTMYLNNILENVIFSKSCPFHLGGKVFSLLTDIFLFYDLSVTGFISNFKFAMLEHFSYGNAMALCTSQDNLDLVLARYTHEDCENARRIMSFRKLIAAETYENRIKLFKDDKYFKARLKEEVIKILNYVEELHVFLRCLHLLVSDLPKTPLGKQIRELYAQSMTTNITSTNEYRECFQLLSFQSRDEFSIKLSKICDILTEELSRSQNSDTRINEILNTLQMYVNNMNTTSLNDEVITENEVNVISNTMDRKQLKETLIAMSKQSKPQNKYEKLRTDILTFLKNIFQEFLLEPSSFYFHEIIFYNDIMVQSHIIGSHRTAIHNALHDPHYYLQCKCCETSDDSRILPCMPDISIVYKLHLECGKMINLYDWLQAYLSVVDPSDVEDENKRIVKPEIQFQLYHLPLTQRRQFDSSKYRLERARDTGAWSERHKSRSKIPQSPISRQSNENCAARDRDGGSSKYRLKRARDTGVWSEHHNNNEERAARDRDDGSFKYRPELTLVD